MIPAIFLPVSLLSLNFSFKSQNERNFSLWSFDRSIVICIWSIKTFPLIFLIIFALWSSEKMLQAVGEFRDSKIVQNSNYSTGNLISILIFLLLNHWLHFRFLPLKYIAQIKIGSNFADKKIPTPTRERIRG